MRYTVRQKMIQNIGHDLTDEQIFRDLAMRIIHDMSYKNLRELMEFSKIDPDSKQSIETLKDTYAPSWQKNIIYHLKDINAVEYEAVLFT